MIGSQLGVPRPLLVWGPQAALTDKVRHEQENIFLRHLGGFPGRPGSALEVQELVQSHQRGLTFEPGASAAPPEPWAQFPRATPQGTGARDTPGRSSRTPGLPMGRSCRLQQRAPLLRLRAAAPSLLFCWGR